MRFNLVSSKPVKPMMGIAIVLFWAFLSGSALSQGFWTKDTSMGFMSRYGFFSCIVDNKIYVIGGGVSPSDTLQVFNPMTHSWSTPSAIDPVPGWWAVGCGAIQGKIYVLYRTYSGATDTLGIYDPGNNHWLVLKTNGSFGPRGQSVVPRNHSATLVIDGKLFFIDGNDFGGTRLTSVEVLDPVANSWSKLVTTGAFAGRRGFTSALVNGKIYVIGGDTGNGVACTNVEVFDPSSNGWSRPATTGIFTPLLYPTSSVVNNKIYVMGGYLFDVPGIEAANLVEIYDPATNSWSEGTPMPTARAFLSSVAVDGKIYALGGYRPHQALNPVEVFTPGPLAVSSEASQLQFNLSPNPTTGTIRIGNAPANVFAVSVMNVLGETLQKLSNPISSNLTLDLTHLPRGTYFVRLESGSGVVMKKVVKE